MIGATMKNLTGKVAFITGGASGIGLGIGKAFAAEGMKLVIADMRQDTLDEAMAYLNGYGAAAYPVKLDVTDRQAYARAADEAETVFGKVHILVNNAGVGVGGPMQFCTYKDWDYGLGVNLGGVINGIVTMLPRMLKHGEEGHITATSSSAGLTAVGNNGIYNTAKYAIVGLMETLATELQGTNISASVFLPGPVATDIAKSTFVNRPQHLKNAGTPESGPAQSTSNQSGFMDPLEAGQRFLRGIKRGDLFIITHAEFKAGIKARNDALIRAVPDEPLNEKRYLLLKNYGTLLYNPIYDRQTTPGPFKSFSD
jgi:NAD(P)-dependent dehydrogenase (short-subunit alcohol dehydrogenase family)